MAQTGTEKKQRNDRVTMAQAVSNRSVTVEFPFRIQVGLSKIYGGWSGTVTGFSLISSVFLLQYYSTVALYSHVSSGGWTKGSLATAVHRHSLAPSILTTKQPPRNSSPAWEAGSRCASQKISGRSERIFPVTSVSRSALGPTQPPVQLVPVGPFPGLKRGRGVKLTTNPI
jgi:hypothetical protein